MSVDREHDSRTARRALHDHRRARQRMLMDGLDATSAAYEVGYESVSQFSREYSRFFGQPPIRDIKALRESNIAELNVA